MADELDEKELRESISEILKKGDLASLTSKKIRQLLEDKYEVSLKDRKKQIDDIVMSLVDEESDEEEDDESQSSDKKTSDEANVPSNKKPKQESPAKKQKVSAASERVSVISVANTGKKKVKDKKSSDSDEESSDDNVSKTRQKRQRTKKPKDKTSKSPKKPPTGEKKKTGFSMPMALSPELATLMGETHMARSEVVKRMWQIIRERDLMDPSNKRYTICDDELEKIIGLKRFLTFSMMKYLKRHVKDPSLMVKSSVSPK